MVGGKVDGQILFGARGEKRKNVFVAKWQLRKFYLEVKGLKFMRYIHMIFEVLTFYCVNYLNFYNT